MTKNAIQEGAQKSLTLDDLPPAPYNPRKISPRAAAKQWSCLGNAVPPMMSAIALRIRYEILDKIKAPHA